MFLMFENRTNFLPPHMNFFMNGKNYKNFLNELKTPYCGMKNYDRSLGYKNVIQNEKILKN